MAPKIQYSCKRKKDFVTFTALSMFLLIVVFELYLVFWLPIQLRRENAMAQYVDGQKLTAHADALRGEVGNFGRMKNSLAAGEVEMVANVLDVLAIYVRENQEKLSYQQIRKTADILNYFAGIAEGWKTGKFHFKRTSFDPNPAIRRIETQLNIK